MRGNNIIFAQNMIDLSGFQNMGNRAHEIRSPFTLLNAGGHWRGLHLRFRAADEKEPIL